MVAESSTRRLTAEDARNKSAECREMAKRAVRPEHRVMLEHMADTWDRIALNLSSESVSAVPEASGRSVP